MKKFIIGLSVTTAFLFALLVPASAMDLQTLQKQIATSGAKWQAGENAVTHLTKEEFAARLTLIHATTENAVPDLAFQAKSNLPSALDWRDIDGQNFVSSVKDQGHCGSCSTFSAVGAFEAAVKIAMGNPFIEPDFSEQQVFSCSFSGCNIGAMILQPLTVLKMTGAADEMCMPYESGDSGEYFPCSDRCSDFNDRIMKLTHFSTLLGPNPETIKTALQTGPISAGMNIYEDFQYYNQGVYEHVSGEYLGGHAIVIVGYNDAEQYWICKNSWSESWGEDGYFRIKWNNSSIASDAYPVSVDSAALCAGNVPPSIESLLMPSSGELLNEDEDLTISFAYTDEDANLAGGELWYTIDGDNSVRYSLPLVSLSGISSEGKDIPSFTITGPFGSGDHEITVFVKDLCGVKSNNLVGTFSVEGDDSSDDESSDDVETPAESDDDDDDDGGSCGC